MIQIKDKKDCCGCSACAQICAKGSITMEMDSEGFRYPKVDTATCVDCGLCEKVCPVLNVEPEVEKPQSAHLLQIKDEVIRKESTSGGSFTSIANWVIEQGGWFTERGSVTLTLTLPTLTITITLTEAGWYAILVRT